MTQVLEVPDNVPVMTGHLLFEQFDFAVGLRSRQLVSRPALGGEHVHEVF